MGQARQTGARNPPRPLTFACVLFKGEDVPEHSAGIFTPEWVDRLYRGIKRNCTRPFRFVCYCDEEYEFSEPVERRPLALPYRNMFSLLEVFREDLGRVVFMGLDTIITGNIDALADYDGPFAMLPDPWHPRPCSGVMAFPYTPGVWQAFRSADQSGHRIGEHVSDMIFLASVPHTLLDDAGIYSYKAHCRDGLPADARIVYFHGREKPHELREDWIAEHWGPPVAHPVTFIEGLNTPISVMLEQARENVGKAPWLAQAPAHGRSMAIVGGGPSLAESLLSLRFSGADVFALNGAHDYLLARGIRPDYHVLLDAREINARFVQNPVHGVHYLVAAPVHPAVLAALQGYRVALWAPFLAGMAQATGAPFLVTGGATVGLKTLFLGHLMGYRDFHLYGMDSSYRDEAHHAYAQDWQGGGRMTITAGGRDFVCDPWMAKQAKEFQGQLRTLIGLGCSVSVHGDGLLPHVARLMSGVTDATGNAGQRAGTG